MTDERRRGLGRGLSALLGDSEPAAAPPAEAKAGIRMVAIEHLHPGRFQPRKRFDEDAMAALAASVAAQGVLQPLLVRRSQTMLDGFEIIAGQHAQDVLQDQDQDQDAEQDADDDYADDDNSGGGGDDYA